MLVQQAQPISVHGMVLALVKEEQPSAVLHQRLAVGPRAQGLPSVWRPLLLLLSEAACVSWGPGWGHCRCWERQEVGQACRWCRLSQGPCGEEGPGTGRAPEQQQQQLPRAGWRLHQVGQPQS